MKIITPEEAERRLNGEGNLATKFRPSTHPVATREEALARWEDRMKERDTPPDSEMATAEVEVVPYQGDRIRMDDDERFNVIVAALASGKSQAEVARELGVSESMVSRLVSGERGSAELQAKVDSTLGKISDAALDRILQSVHSITDEKLTKSSAKEAASVAKDLTSVVDKITNRGRKDAQNVKVVIVQPSQGSLEDYEVIQIQAT